MSIPTDLLFLPSHEWVRLDGQVATVGISDFAQDQLGDIVFVELPAVGARLADGDSFGTIESVKAAEDLYTPVPGEVIAVHEGIEDSVEQINEDPYGKGWLIQVKVADDLDTSALLDPKAYEAHLETEGH